MARILLVNPPIYDFSAYDFWLKPYGLLQIAGSLRKGTKLYLFDYLDRSSPSIPRRARLRSDQWGRGEFYGEIVPKPSIFSQIPRYYRRFGLPRKIFQDFLLQEHPFDFALIQTGMTYWYMGVREVIQDIQTFSPQTKIVLGGIYATLCPHHACELGADLVIQGSDTGALWDLLGISPCRGLPFWEGYKDLKFGVLKLTDGCPFRCNYCSAPLMYPGFMPRPLDRSLAELFFLYELGVKNVAFYDDALLFQSQKILIPFLQEVLKQRIEVNFHTPNALNPRLVTQEVAGLMVEAGFKTFYLGFESASYQWHKDVGGKLHPDELAQAVEILTRAGANPASITAYVLIGHPSIDEKSLESSIHFVHRLGIRVMFSEFSPIPSTPGGQVSQKWVDMEEPLWHNKTVFPILLFGEIKVNRLKELCRRLNRRLSQVN